MRPRPLRPLLRRSQTRGEEDMQMADCDRQRVLAASKLFALGLMRCLRIHWVTGARGAGKKGAKAGTDSTDRSRPDKPRTCVQSTATGGLRPRQSVARSPPQSRYPEKLARCTRLCCFKLGRSCLRERERALRGSPRLLHLRGGASLHLTPLCRHTERGANGAISLCVSCTFLYAHVRKQQDHLNGLHTLLDLPTPPE